MAYTLACGFECGVFSTPGHWSLTGTGGFVTSPVRSGNRAMRLNPTAAAGAVTSNTVLSSTVGGSVRTYIRFATLPGADMNLVTGQGEGAYFVASDSTIRARANGTNSSTGVAVTTETWYQIDVKIDWTFNGSAGIESTVRVNGSTVTVNSTTRAGTGTTLDVGPTTGTHTFDLTVDDVVGSDTLTEYPIGPGVVYPYVPTSDSGGHNISGSGDFDRGDTGTDILSSTTDSYLLVDDVPLPSGTVDQADCIRALAPAAGEYTENKFGPAPGIPSATAAPVTVEAICVFHKVATQAANVRIRLHDNATSADIFNDNPSGTTYNYARKHYATGPSGAAWNLDASGDGSFPDIRVRFGSGDANPDNAMDAIMLEVAFADDGLLGLWRPTFPDRYPAVDSILPSGASPGRIP